MTLENDNQTKKYVIHIELLVPQSDIKELKPYYLKYVKNLNFHNNIQILYEMYDEIMQDDTIYYFEANNGQRLHYIITCCFLHKIRNIFNMMDLNRKKYFFEKYKNIFLKKNSHSILDQRFLRVLETNIEIENIVDFNEYSIYFLNISNCLYNCILTDFDYFLFDDYVTLGSQLLTQFESLLRYQNEDVIIKYYVSSIYKLNHYTDYYYLYIVYIILLEKIIYVDDTVFIEKYKKYIDFFNQIYLQNLDNNNNSNLDTDKSAINDNMYYFSNIKTMLILRLLMCTNKKVKLFKMFKTLNVVWEIKTKKNINIPIKITNEQIFREYMRLSISDCLILFNLLNKKICL
jgi:hypothetical protein